MNRLGDRIYLKLMQEAMEKVTRYCGQKALADISKDENLFDATAWRFQMIQQASLKVSEETRERYSGYPWKITDTLKDGTTDLDIHIRIERLCDVISNDLNYLLSNLSQITQAEDKYLESQLIESKLRKRLS